MTDSPNSPAANSMDSASAHSMGDVLKNHKVVVVCGSGGVGKTTTAAAIAAKAAVEYDRRVLVMTVDPARRLADALGAKDVGNEAGEVDTQSLTRDGQAPKGRLFAAMLDAKQSWDALVDRHAPDAATKQQIIANPLYRNITERFVQSHDYIAMERLHELHDSGDYDLIVIDTPPASHAIDFLEAPARMADFFDSRLLKFLVAPSKSRIMSLTSKPFLQVADRLLGKRFLSDITEFFTSLESMRPGFIARAEQVGRLLASDQTTFIVVTTLEHAPRNEATKFIDELKKRSLRLGAVVLNRVLPSSLSDAATADAANELKERAADLSAQLTADPDDQKRMQRVLSELKANADRLGHLADEEQRQRKALEAIGAGAVIASVPWLSADLDDVSSLLGIGDTIWGES